MQEAVKSNMRHQVNLNIGKSKALDKRLQLIPRAAMNKKLPDTGETGQATQARYERSVINSERSRKGLKSLTSLSGQPKMSKDILGKALIKKTK